MALLNILGKLFGNKYEKDVKNIMPIVKQINDKYSSFSSLNNDQLRSKTQELKNKISEHIKTDKEEISNLKEKAESDISAEEKEILYDQIDKKEVVVIEKLEEVLSEILPTLILLIFDLSNKSGGLELKILSLALSLISVFKSNNVTGIFALHK